MAGRNLVAAFIVLMPGALFLGLWQLAVAGSSRRQFLFGSPLAVLIRASEEYPRSGVWVDIGVTAFEAAGGLILGSVVGIAAALLLYAFPRAERLSRFYLALAGSIPVFAIAPMLIIWFGIGLLPKIMMAAFGVFLITLIHTYEGLRTAAPQHIDFAHLLGARSRDVMQKILLPSAFRWLGASLQINVGTALLGAFIGEFVTSSAGIGHYIVAAAQLYDMPGVLFGILNIALLALAMGWIIGFCRRALWKSRF